MKIKISHLIIIFLIIILILFIFAIIRINYIKKELINEKIIIEPNKKEEIIKEEKIKEGINKSTNSLVSKRSILDDDNIKNSINISNSLNKDNNEEDEIKKYYFHKNWFIEDIVVDERKEELSIFERLDGKKAEIKKTTKRVYKWLKDIEDRYSYVKNSFVLIPIYIDSEYGYKYYFDKDGYLIRDNISSDFSVIDKYGREIDSELEPIKYYIGKNSYSLEKKEEVVFSKEDIYREDRNRSINATPAQVIITEGVVFRNKLEKIYNTQIDNDLIKYIKSGYRYSNNVKATIYTKAKWKKALKLDGDNSYVVFENYTNNFNKIYGKVSLGAVYTNEKDTLCKVLVYDKREYDKGNFDDYIISIDNFNYKEPQFFSFTFDRSIKDIVFLLEISGKRKSKSIYFKDLKFGFDKNAYRKELIRKREDEEEIEYLRSLGIYVENDNYFDIIDDEGNLMIEDDLVEEREVLSNYTDYDEYLTELVDSNTGPDFDEELKRNDGDNKIFGPYTEIIGTSSNIFSDNNRKKRQSKIIYTN